MANWLPLEPRSAAPQRSDPRRRRRDQARDLPAPAPHGRAGARRSSCSAPTRRSWSTFAIACWSSARAGWPPVLERRGAERGGDRRGLLWACRQSRRVSVRRCREPGRALYCASSLAAQRGPGRAVPRCSQPSLVLYAILFPGILSVSGDGQVHPELVSRWRWSPWRRRIVMLTGGIDLAVGAMVSLGSVSRPACSATAWDPAASRQPRGPGGGCRDRRPSRARSWRCCVCRRSS